MAWSAKNLEENRHRPALAAMQKALALQETARARLMLARFYATSVVSEFKDRDKARENARRAYELDPENYHSLLEIVELLAAAGDFDEAQRMRERAEELASKRGSSRRRQREQQRLKSLRQEIEEKRAQRAAAKEAEPSPTGV
mgnify:CR=1 FL=1